MKEIRVTTQAELDAIPENYDGYIKIYGKEPIKVSKRYIYAVRVFENSSVDAYGKTSVYAYENSSVDAFGNSSVVAHNNSRVYAFDNSRVTVYDNSRVYACGDSSVDAYGKTTVYAYENSSVDANDNSSVVAHNNSRVEAFGKSTVYAYDNSVVYAYDNSVVYAYDNSRVDAYGNVQVLELSATVSTAIKGNARLIKMTNSLEEFIKYYDVKSTKTTVTLYKAVHKIADKYFSDYKRSYEYKIGEKRVEQCDTDTGKECSYGLHLAPLYKAVEYGKNWEDLAILECKAKKTNLVIPQNNDGKIRTSELTVMREIPLEECGLLGEMIAKRRINNERN